MQTDYTPWPCTEFKQYPLDPHWTDTFPQMNISQFRYVHLVNASRSLFLSPALADTYAQFRNYAFQQGAYTNANQLDLEFFYNMLTHDYAFFTGSRGTEVQSAFKLEGSQYQGMPLLKCSHFDIYRVEKSFLGFCRLKSMTNPSSVNAFISLTQRPRSGDLLFVRLMPVGLFPRAIGTSAVEPWDTIHPDYMDSILSTYHKQHALFCKKFPNTSTRAFNKIAGYQIYELIQYYELHRDLSNYIQSLNIKDEIHGRTYTYKFKDRIPFKLTDIPGAQPVKGDDGDIPDLATVPIADSRGVPETLREAIVSKDGRTIEITYFMKEAGNRFIESVWMPMTDKYKTTQSLHILDENEMYRSLRHLSLVIQNMR